jgi:hypothetical protein
MEEAMRRLVSVLLIVLAALPLLPDCAGPPSGGPGASTGPEGQPPSVPLDPIRAHFPSGGR